MILWQTLEVLLKNRKFNSHGDTEIVFKDAPAAGASTALLEERVNNKETLLAKISDNLVAGDAPKKSQQRHRSPSWSSSESSESKVEGTRHSRHHRTPPSKSASRFSYESIFPEEDIVIKSFEGVILALFNTFDLFAEGSKRTNGLDAYGKYLDEKACSESYVPEAFVGYDDSYMVKLVGRDSRHLTQTTPSFF